MPNVDPLEADVLALQEQLARLEQEYAELRVELDEFELRYKARVGPLEAQLAQAQLRIEEYELRIELVQLRGRSLGPQQLEAEVEYRLRDKRERAEAIRANAEAAQLAVPPRPVDPAAHLDLKQAYRELAKRTHPDLAIDEEDRAARSRSMTTVNALYARRDLEGLRQLLRQLEARRILQSESPAQRRARLQDDQRRLSAAIRHVKSEIAELNRSPMMVLKLDAALARAQRRDVLAEVMRQMQARLDEAESELSALIVKFRDVIEAAGLTEDQA